MIAEFGLRIADWKRLVACVAALGLVSSAFAQRNLKDIPDPDPELERKTFTVAEGFEVNLFAGDPQIAKPIQMAFDAEGKLWIASSSVYPQIKPGEKANDKILVLEDTDQDGEVDKTTVFADGLLIPTGVLPGDGGAYVVNSTELLHLKDTDGDGRADQRRVMLSGFGAEDTHHILHSLRWGVDGAIYMNQSIYIHSHIETPHGVRRLNGGGIWRYRPDTGELEVFCRGFVNSWGHIQDRWGQSFATDGAYGEGINYTFPGAIFVASPGEKRRLRGLNPGSPKHCGLEVLSGSHLPEDYRGDMITNDFRAHRVCRFKLTEDGSGYASRQQVELIKSMHVAFRPVDVKMGPDGAIYIADWYNPIIQHGEVDFRDPRRDRVHGRIWRVTAKDRPLVKRQQIVGAPIEELLEMLKAEEDWVRIWAKQELKQRHKEETVLWRLQAWLNLGLDKDDPDYSHHRLEALYMFQTLNIAAPALLSELLTDANPRVRSAALRVASAQQDRLENATEWFADAVRDEHPRVRLEAVRALAKIPSARSAELAAEVLNQPMDRFLDFALWQAMRDLKPHWLSAVERGELDFGGNVAHLTFALKAVDSPAIVPLMLERIAAEKLTAQQLETSVGLVAELGNPQQLLQLLSYLVEARDKRPAAETAAALGRMVDVTGAKRAKPARFSPLTMLLDSESKALRIAAMRAAGTWKSDEHRSRLTALLVQDQLDDLPERLAAIDAVASYGSRASIQAVSKEALEADELVVRMHATAALARVSIIQAAPMAANLLAGMEPTDDPSPLLHAILTQKEGPAQLAAAVVRVKLKTDVAKTALRIVRTTPGDTSELQAAIRHAGGISAEPKKYTAEEIAALVDEIQKTGDPHAGQAVYRRAEMQCIKCHAIGGSGGRVGPDMISIGASAPVDYLVQSLVDPNAKVKENFHSITVETDRGRIYSGIAVARAGGVLTLRDKDGKLVAIPLAAIVAEDEGRSLMPEGLVDPLTRRELIDLTAFLSQLGKEGDFAVGQARVVRTWRKLVWTKEGHHRLNRTSHDTAATDDPALTWAPAYSRVAGDLPLAGLAPFEIHRGHPANSFVRFEIEVSTPGEIGLQFGDASGLKLWIADKPTAIEKLTKANLPKGRHRFTLAIDRTKRTSPLQVELVDVEGSAVKAEIVGGE